MPTTPDAVFLSVRCTVMRLHFGAISSSTIRSARSRSVQPLRPSGGSESRNAMSSASCLPSRSLSEVGTSRFLPPNAMSKPSVTSRLRIFSTHCREQRKASAMSRSFQWGPLASALSKMWARRTFCEVPLSFVMTSSQVFRSSSVNRTM